MNILHISKYYEPFKGGIEEVAKNVIEVFADSADVEQKVFCFNDNGENQVDEIGGGEVIRVKREFCLLSQPISFRYKNKLEKVLRSFKSDHIVFHYPNPYAAFFLLKLMPPNVMKLVVYWHLDIVRQKLLEYVFHFQNLALLKRADRIIATSSNYMDESPYLSKMKTKCEVVPNCINENRLAKTPKSDSLFHKIKRENLGKVICFSVGRLVPYKGYEYLIQAAEMLPENIVFYIVGSGFLNSKLREMTSSCANVKFLGEVTEDELMAYYSAADIFCFPSKKSETFGIALTQEMFFNLPAVTYTIKGSGVNFVSLDGIKGLEAPNRNAKAFADCVMKLAANVEMRKAMSDKAHARCVENFLLCRFRENLKKTMEDIFVV